MRRLAAVALLLFAGVYALGCSTDYEVGTEYGASTPTAADHAAAPADSPASPPNASAASSADEAGKAPGLGRAGSGPAAPRATAAPSRTSPSASDQQAQIELSAGVALPQSMPGGTMMTFSVDYRFTAGGPGPSPYVWVIQPAKGQAVKQQVPLRRRGTLQGIVQQFRPENGPFRTHLEDARGTPVSPSVPLRPAGAL